MKTLANKTGQVWLWKAQGVLPAQTLVRTNKRLNNLIEQDHRKAPPFCGSSVTIMQSADLLKISPLTVRRDWSLARVAVPITIQLMLHGGSLRRPAVTILFAQSRLYLLGHDFIYSVQFLCAEQFSDEFCDVGALRPLNALYLHFHLASLVRLRRKAIRSHCFGGA